MASPVLVPTVDQALRPMAKLLLHLLVLPHLSKVASFPPGWVQQFDQQSQRFFYVNQATGQTQWDMPQHPVSQNQYSSPPPPTGGAYGGYQAPPPQGQYGQPSHSPYSQAPPPQGQYGAAPPHGDQSRGQANSFYDSYGGAMPSVPPQGQHDTRSNQYYGDVDNKEKDKKKDEKKSGGYGGALGGAAAGLVVGGIGGALIADALGKCSKLDGYLILSLLIL
ncbi:unnamed protein product [Aureobasidium pullulans]|nr:unnamed protein product [Aureobasidium pullulans]